MKKIQPITIWYNGKQEEVDILSANANYDNLIDSASFNYQLMQSNSPSMGGALSSLFNGNLTMTGEIYNNWETNDYAYNWIAQQLNIVIIGDY